MTGRGSIFRGEILENKHSLQVLNAHIIEYRRKKHTKAVTGDDKTTVYLTWLYGFETFFIPDTYLYAMEEPLPCNKFLEFCGLRSITSIFSQEMRYTRNMQLMAPELWRVRPRGWKYLSTAIKLLDQRYFFWAALVGPISACIATVKFHPVVFLVWLLSTIILRIIITLVQGGISGKWHPLMPLISLLNIPQAIIKIVSRYNLDVGKWKQDGTEIKYNWWKPFLHIGAMVGILSWLIA